MSKEQSSFLCKVNKNLSNLEQRRVIEINSEIEEKRLENEKNRIAETLKKMRLKNQ